MPDERTPLSDDEFFGGKKPLSDDEFFGGARGQAAPAQPKRERTWTEYFDQGREQPGTLFHAVAPLTPAEYDARHPLTPEQRAAPMVITNAAPMSTGQRLLQSASDTAEHYSPAAIAARSLSRLVPAAEDYRGAPGADNSVPALRARAAPRVTNTERDWRDLSGSRAAGDPAWVSGAPLSANLDREAASLVGSLLGGMISDPTTMIAPGEGWLARTMAQAGVSGATDAGTQGLEMGEGVRDQFDPMQTLISAGLGGLLQGGFEAIPAVRRRLAERGAADAAPPPEMTYAPLDLPDIPPPPAARHAGAGIGSRSMSDITAQTESGGHDLNPNGTVVTSSKGARGKMQVMDFTNSDPGYGVRPTADNSLAERARVGRDYLAALTDHYGGDPAKGWSSYNAGPGRTDAAIKKYGDQWLDHMPAETQAYVRKNMAALGESGGQLQTGPVMSANETHTRNEPQPGTQDMAGYQNPLPEPAPQELQGVRGEGNPDLPPMANELPSVLPGDRPASEPNALSGPDRQSEGLRAGERPVGDAIPASAELLARPADNVPRSDNDGSGVGPRIGDRISNDNRSAESASRAGASAVDQATLSASAEAGARGAVSDNFGVGPADRRVEEHPQETARGRDSAASRPVEPNAPTRRLADDLTTIADTHPEPRMRDLARRLAPLVGDTPVRGGPITDLEGRAYPDLRGATIRDSNGNVSSQVRDVGDVETSLHEGIHSATLRRYGELKAGAAEGTPAAEPVRAIQALHARAQQAFRRRPNDPTGAIGHAMSTPDEFLAMGMTSKPVQKFLKSQNEAGLWGRFVDGVRNVLGIEPKHRTMLDRTLSSGEGVIRAMEEGAPKEAVPSQPAAKQASPEAAGQPVEPTDVSDHHQPADGGAQLTLFSKGAAPSPEGWKQIGKLVFERDFMDGAPASVDAIRATFGEPRAALKGVGQRLAKFAEVTQYSIDSELRSIAGRVDAPSFAKLADEFHSEVAKPSGGETYSEAVPARVTAFGNELSAAIKSHIGSPAEMTRIRDLLTEPNATLPATASERKAAETVRDLLKRIIEYRRDAGETIGEVQDGYFPRRLRVDKVAARSEDFLARATKLYENIGADDPAASANAWLQRSMDAHAGIADGLEFAGSAGRSSAQARTFGKEADRLLRDFYETNPLVVLSDYILGSVRRAEEARRFGPKGREGSPERLTWQAEHGDKSQWDVLRGQMQAELRASDQKVSGLMERADSLRDTLLGKMSPGQRQLGSAVSILHTWNQLGKLGKVIIASLPEAAMGFMHGPKIGGIHLATTFQEFGRALAKMEPSDARLVAEASGIVGNNHAADIIRARNDDPMAHLGTQKLMAQFYKKTGIIDWTDSTRTAAVKDAQILLDTWSRQLSSSNAKTRSRATGDMRELGIADPAAFGKQLIQGRPTHGDIRADQGFAREYGIAVHRFANQMTLIPTRAMKPRWASTPLGSLVFALQSFSYAFKKQILDRVARRTTQAIVERDIHKLDAAAGMAVLIAATAAVQEFREYLFGAAKSAGDDETWLHYSLRIMDRTGLFAGLSPYMNGLDGLRYHRSLGESLQGSVIGSMTDAADAAGGLALGNSEDTNTAERKAAAALYDTVVKPAEDAVGAGVLNAPIGAAVIVGTGTRNDDGLLPSDREAFTTALAGEKQE